MKARKRNASRALISLGGILLLASCATAPASLEYQLHELLPPGHPVYFGLDSAASIDILTTVLPQAYEIEGATDRISRVVGYATEDMAFAALVYGHFAQGYARIALRRTGFRGRRAPEWSRGRRLYSNSSLGVSAVVLEPGVVAVGNHLLESLVSAYFRRPYSGPVETVDFPVSLVANADAVVVARVTGRESLLRSILDVVTLRSAATWMYKTGEGLYGVDAHLWFDETGGTRAYAAVLRLATATWLVSQLGMERERVRGGLEITRDDRGIHLSLPPLSAAEIGLLLQSYPLFDTESEG